MTATAPLPGESREPQTAEITGKLQWLMFFRVVMITVLLGGTLLLSSRTDPITDRRSLAMIGLIVGIYLLTIIYALVHPRLKRGHETFAYLQLFIDLGWSTVLIALTGGTESLFLFMFSLTVLNAAILLYRRGAMYTSALSTLLIVFLVAREAMGWGVPAAAREAELRSIFLSGMLNVSAVFLVALLAGYLSEQLRAAGQRLEFYSQDIQALKDLNEHIITSIQSGLVSYTLDHKIIFFNPAAERITGLDPDKILLADVRKAFPTVEEHESSMGRWEQAFVRPDGEERTLGFSLSPLYAGMTQQGWILIFQDLSPLVTMQRQIRRSEQLAAIGKLAAGIAHEIRNPLASMTGSIQMLNESVQMDAMERKLMGIVQREADRLNALITDFLQFARPTAPTIERLGVRQVVEEVAEVFAYLDYETDDAPVHQVDIDVPADLEVDADRGQIKQVLWNLMNNAAEATPAGGTIEVSARVEGLGDAQRVAIHVRDFGCGIPDELVSRIFDPFFTTKDSGSGLGLAQSYRILEEHGGVLQVESEADAGSTFSLYLPLQRGSITEEHMLPKELSA